MTRFRPLLRLTSFLLSLCVLVGAVGVPTAAWECGMGDTAPASCCAVPTDLSTSADQEDDGCCSVTVAYDHVVTNSVGPVFTLDWPAPIAALPSSLGEWRPVTGTVLPVGVATIVWLFGADSGPPGRVVGRALILALHQLRN